MPRKPTPPVLESLLDAFAEVPDPRVARTRAHPLVNVLTIALFGAISGADGWEALEIFAEQRASFFKTFLSMPKGGLSPAVTSGTSSTGITGDQGPTRWRGDGSSPCS